MNTAVLFEKRDVVAHVILNRPEQLNAMNLDLIEGLAEAVKRCEDPSIRAVILRANGRCFCAGGDIKFFNQLVEQGKSIPPGMPDKLHEMVEGLRTLEKPVLASVHGAAAGAGAPLALACDLVIASEEAKFNFAYARIGLTPDGSSTFFLPRHLGLKKATEIFMTIPTFSAKEAMEWGLVNWVVPAGELSQRTEEIAAQLAQGPTKSYGRLKKLLNVTHENSLHDQLRLETEAISASSRDEDFREGIRSFLKKRLPSFKGK